MSRERILIVEDEKTLRRVLSALLTDAGYEAVAVESGEEAMARADGVRPDLVLLDLRLGGMGGLEVMESLRRSLPPPVPAFVIMTAHGTIRSAVEAVRRGAADYVTKPFDNDELQIVVERALQVRRLEQRVEALETQLDERFRPENMVAQSGAMDAVFRMIRRIAPVNATVLINGESGTGKELAARAIHRYSPRKDRAFVAVNCGAIPPTLMEATFFGHERGAFTDAKTTRRGAFEEADGGTLFLDEAGELSAAAQAGLLRALQEGEIRRVGGERTIRVDTRLIAATHRDLQAEVAAGRFREDLYWRLNVIALQLPPLRERPEDVPALVDHFLDKHAARLGVPRRPVSSDALSLLMAYDWPGNVRELENAIERALILSPGPAITAGDLPSRIVPSAPERLTRDGVTLGEAVARAQGAVEERMIREALLETGGNRSRAADRLGISRKTLFNKMQELGIAGSREAADDGAPVPGDLSHDP